MRDSRPGVEPVGFRGNAVVVIDADTTVSGNFLRVMDAKLSEGAEVVQAYYAVKANAEAAIVRTLYDLGASFDVASLPEFMLVYENIRRLPPKDAGSCRPKDANRSRPEGRR